MIALADGLPLVRLEDGESVPFQRNWLLRALLQGAERAGYQKWWLAEHVAESVIAYLALQYEGTVVSTSSLLKAVQSALQVIGYGEIAPYISLGTPGVRLSLADLADEAGSGYELLFFTRLGARVQALISNGTTFLELVDLDPCVRQLRARKSWGRDCEALQADIVSFVRRQATAAPAGEEVTVTLL